MIEPFAVDVQQAVLDDLGDRLAATRWTEDFANDDWRYGANAAYIRELAEYWRVSYDWRARERMMNSFAHFRAEIDGVPIHFIHGARSFPPSSATNMPTGYSVCI